MLDSFMKVACSRSEKLAARDRLVEKMHALPEEVLLKIATGEEKLGFGCSIDGVGGNWLDRFKGTPLMAHAIELEKQDLQQQMAERARWREDDQTRSAQSAVRDELSIQRRMLELQLAEHEAGAAGGEAQAFAGAETPEEEALEHGAGSPEVAAAQAQQAPPAPAPAAPKEESAEKAAMKFAYAKMKMAGKNKVAILIPGDTGALVGAARGEEGDRLNNALRGAVGEIGGAGVGGGLGALAGHGIGKLVGGWGGIPSRLPILNNAGMAGSLLGGAVGAGIGIKKMTDSRVPTNGPATSQVPVSPESREGALFKLDGDDTYYTKEELEKKIKSENGGEQPVAPGLPENKMAAAFKKEAIGLGLLGTAAGGAAKSIGGAGMKAFQAARGFGSSLPQAAGMGAKAVMGQAPGALKTLGRAATSYAKANPLQAAGIAGAAGLGAGYALS